MKYLLLLIPLLFIGCNEINVAKGKAWAKIKCKPHLGVYKTQTIITNESRTYCKDGTFYYERDIHEFTHPTVADYLPKDSHEQ